MTDTTTKDTTATETAPSRGAKRARHHAGEVGLLELARRDVDVDRQRRIRAELGAPGGRLAAGLAQHPLAELLHQADLLGGTGLPRTEICFFVYQAPNEAVIKPVNAGLPCDEIVVAMDPVVGKKKCGRPQDGQQDQQRGEKIAGH